MLGARVRALEDATKKAEELAKHTGVKLGRLLEVSEPSLSGPYQWRLRFAIDPSLAAESPQSVEVEVTRDVNLPAALLTYKANLDFGGSSGVDAWQQANEKGDAAYRTLRETFAGSLDESTASGYRVHSFRFEGSRQAVGTLELDVRIRGRREDSTAFLDRLKALGIFSSIRAEQVEASPDSLRSAVNEARETALKDAEQQARELARGQGAKLGQALLVVEEPSTFPPRYPQQRLTWRIRYAVQP